MNKREIIKDLLNGNPKEKEAAIQELKNPIPTLIILHEDEERVFRDNNGQIKTTEEIERLQSDDSTRLIITTMEDEKSDLIK